MPPWNCGGGSCHSTLIFCDDSEVQLTLVGGASGTLSNVVPITARLHGPGAILLKARTLTEKRLYFRKFVMTAFVVAQP